MVGGGVSIEREDKKAVSFSPSFFFLLPPQKRKTKYIYKKKKLTDPSPGVAQAHQRRVQRRLHAGGAQPRRQHQHGHQSDPPEPRQKHRVERDEELVGQPQPHVGARDQQQLRAGRRGADHDDPEEDLAERHALEPRVEERDAGQLRRAVEQVDAADELWREMQFVRVEVEHRRPGARGRAVAEDEGRGPEDGRVEEGGEQGPRLGEDDGEL